MEASTSTIENEKRHKTNDMIMHRSDYVEKLNSNVIMITAVCAITAMDYISKGSNYLAPYVKAYANESLSRNYEGKFTSSEQDWVRSITVSSTSFAQLIGYFLLPTMMIKFGRRMTGMVIANSLLILACCMQVICVVIDRYELYIVGQFLNGLGMAFAPALYIFLAEAVPKKYRGMSSMAVNAGSYIMNTLAALLALPAIFGNNDYWFLYPVVGILLALPQLCAWKFFPEPARQLYIIKNNKKKALKSLQFYHGTTERAEKIFAAWETEELLTKRVTDLGIVEILLTRHLRIPMMLCWLGFMAGAVSGNAIKAGYMSEMFIQFGVPKELSMLPIIGVNLWSLVIGMSVAIILIEKVGRRPLMLGAIFVDILGIICMALADRLSPSESSGILGFSGALLLTTAIVLGLYKLPVLYMAEICPQASRSVTAGICYVSTTLATLIQSLLFPPTHAKLHAWSWVIIFTCEMFCFIVLFIFLPETKGKSVNRIVARWITPKSRCRSRLGPSLCVEDFEQDQNLRTRHKSSDLTEDTPLLKH